MKTSEFFRKFTSRYLWLNLLAMALLIVLIVVGTGIAMDIYTHHGETITVPDVRKRPYEETIAKLLDMGLNVEVNDTGYVKSLPPGTILNQLPVPGTVVKSGRTIFLTLNATDSPTLVLPDIIDNCSLREAMARLQAMGFKLGETQFVAGEKDWVYGIIVNGKEVSAGDRISSESILFIQAGNGQRDAADSIYITDTPDEYYDEEITTDGSSPKADAPADDTDDFEIIE